MSLNTPQQISARGERLGESHLTALEHWRRGLIANARRVPHFDPSDGGDEARLLVLLETPGPGTAPMRFVSRDNPTGTARNLAMFLDDAGVSRAGMVLWNTVPWIVHEPGARNRAARRAEIAEGLQLLPGFLELLPQLSVILLAGRVAAQAVPVIARVRSEVAIVTIPHPSPTYVCTNPDVAQRIRDGMQKVATLLDSSSMNRSI